MAKPLKKINEGIRKYLMSVPMFLLLVGWALAMGFGFSTTNDFTRRPLNNFHGLGVAFLLVAFPVAYAVVKHLDRK